MFSSLYHLEEDPQLTDLAAAASYLIAAIADATDRKLADELLEAIAGLLPYHLRAGLDELELA